MVKEKKPTCPSGLDDAKQKQARHKEDRCRGSCRERRLLL
jgi:hypothetical protein